MNHPYFLLTLLLVFAFGIAFGVIWYKSYGYFKYTPDRRPPDKLQQPRVCRRMYAQCGVQQKWDEEVEHEVQMMQDAKNNKVKGGDSE